MPRPQTTPDPVALRSELLTRAGVPHGFSTRKGGVSIGPFASLNLGNPGGTAPRDESTNIRRNYDFLQTAVGVPNLELLQVHQVHGKIVAVASAGVPFDNHQQADAIVSNDAGRVASVRVADCAPVLLSCPKGAVVAAIHAGWRGVVAGAAVAALRVLTELARCDAHDVIAAIGPCIGFDAFEVGPEVLFEFARVFGPAAPLRRRADGKGFVDLKESLRLQLISAGVASTQIDVIDRCTFEDADHFFSHRRDAGVTGRMAALIAPRSLS